MTHTDTHPMLSLSAEEVQSLLDQQRTLESQAVEWGAHNFRTRVEKAAAYGEATVAGAARKALQDDMEKLIARLTEHMAAFAGKRGVKPLDYKLITIMDDCLAGLAEATGVKSQPTGIEVVGYITAKVVLDHLAEKVAKSKVLMVIAERVIDQARIYRFQAQAPALFQYIVKGFRTTNYTHMAKVMDHAIGTAKDLSTGALLSIDMSDLDAITDQQRATLGTMLLDHFIQSTGAVTVEDLIHVTNRRGKKEIRTESCVVPTAKTAEWIDARNAAAAVLCPVNLPMVVPPLPWGPSTRGGYRFGLFRKYTFVRTASKAHRTFMEAQEMPAVYAAVNALQNTAWKINPAVLSLLEAIQALGGDMAGVPKLDRIPLPTKPADIATNDEARLKYRKDARKVHEANLTRRLKAADYLRTMQAAAKVQDAKAIWFPYNVDFRGRVYPISSYLNPQGDDLSKGLLMFADGKPLGATGARYLALHGTTTLDKLPDGRKVSTLTLDERVEWVEKNTAAIVAVAKDPMGNRWWTEAEEPLSFYAFCCEWAGYADQGESYVCALPVCVDGTCNGLQHFGALFADEVGGAAVNLVPMARQNDVYRLVAESVLATLQERAATDDLAALWLRTKLIDRKLCKRPTMTFGYGSKAYGFSKQIVEELKGRENFKREIRPLFDCEQDGKTREGGLLSPAADYLAKLIYATLRDIVKKAVEGMEWMQRAARQVVKGGKCVEWTVPVTGFRVKQHYMVMEKKQIRTALCGGISRAVVRTETQEVAIHKQANAVAPNVVHSLDAAALMLTVGAALEKGVTHFQMIHDSYGTHPADMGALAAALREQFIRLYSTGVKESMAAQFAAQAPEDAEMPAVPASGNLDLAGIANSPYFFC